MSAREHVLQRIGERMVAVLDEHTDLTYEETMQVLCAITGACIDAYARNMQQADSSLHFIYRTVRHKLYEMEANGELAYQNVNSPAVAN